MTTFSVHEAKTNLSKLLASAEAGEEVVIARGKTPVARLVAVAPPKPVRKAGMWKGMFRMDDSFFDPLPDDELALWNGEGD